MTGSDDTSHRQAPRFDHIIYGLPSEVAPGPEPEEAPGGLLRTGKRKVGAGIVAAVLLTGGAGGAFAMHDRNQQADVGPPTQQVEEPSERESAQAAELEAARAELEQHLDRAREVYAVSRDFLEPDDDARAALRQAIEDAARPFVADDATAEISHVAEVVDSLVAATEAVETAMDRTARTALTDAVDDARETLMDSAGRVADEEIRDELAEAIEAAEALLESDDVAPHSLLERADALAELIETVADAVEGFELQLQQQQQEQVWQPPAVQPSVENDNTSQRNTRGGTGSSQGGGSSDESTPAAEEESSEEPTESTTEAPTDPAPAPSTEPTDDASVPPPATEDPTDDVGPG